MADIWLQPDGEGGVRWLSADRIITLPIARPSALTAPPSLRELSDHGARWGLHTVLAPDLGRLLIAALEADGAGRVRLHLDAALDASWQRLPYEYLRHRGTTLHGRLTVSRYAPPVHTPTTPVDPAQDSVILNLLPRTDPDQPWRRVLGLAQVIHAAAAGQFLRQADLPHLAALIVVAHGTENGADLPFRAPDGSPWALPTERGLPPLVVLLACGDDGGNLIDLGRRLLDAGVRTVIAPLGRPTLPGAGQYLADFLPRWVAGERVDDALCAAAAVPETAAGARRLLLLGDAGLRRLDGQAEYGAWSDAQLASAVRRNDAQALTALLWRLTQRFALAGPGLDGAETELRRLLAVAPADEAREQWLLGMLSAVEPGLMANLTRAWVCPLLALLAEAYAHDLIPRVERIRAALDAADVPLTPRMLHCWSRIYYRRGRYGLSLRDVAKGLQLMERTDPSVQTTDFLGHMVDLAIDLDLPRHARAIAVQLEEALANQHQAGADWQRHKLMDRQARIALRSGELRTALTLFRLKRDEAMGRFDRDGVRELAWLLYVAAWLPPAGLAERAEWAQWLRAAQDYLAAHQDLGGLGAGNFDVFYVLRACAAYGWRYGDRSALDCVFDRTERLRERLFAAQQDPGPLGFCFTFLHLAVRAGSLPASLNIPSWDGEIRPALETHRYFFELAGLAHLLGRGTQAKEYLERFQGQRRLPAGISFPDWYHGGLLSDWDSLCAERAIHEAAVLAGDGMADAAKLAGSGLLPL